MLTQNKLTMGISFNMEGSITDQIVFSVPYGWCKNPG
jgi:hypothetical protein